MARLRTLIIGPSWVGDMVMAQSLFKLLKQNNPDLIIDVLAPSWTFSLLACMPEIANAIEMPINHGELKFKKRYQIAQQLRSVHYQQAIVLPNSFKSALIPYLAKIKQRTGWRRELRQLLLNDSRVLDKKRYPLMIEQYLALGLPADAALPTPYPYPSFHVNIEASHAALSKLKLVITDRPILAICAGAEFGPSKRWPPAYFAQVAKQKINEGWDVWLFGSPKDEPVGKEIMALINTNHESDSDHLKNLIGLTTLADTIALLSHEKVVGVISNDSGLMHIASALNKPLIAIYGSTSPLFTPPLSKNAHILQLNLNCQPCFERHCPLKHHQCMLDLKPEMVLSAMHTNWGL